jgi:hypothetical protein
MKEQSLYHNYNWDMRISAIPEMISVVKTTVPSITCDPTYTNSQTGRYPLMGEILQFENLSCSVILDEKWENYKAILDWLYSLRSPKTLTTHKADRPSRANVMLSIKGNQGGPNLKMMFYDVKPIALGGVELNVQAEDTPPSIFDLTMAYSYFEFLND